MLIKYVISIKRYEGGKVIQKMQKTGWAYEATNKEELEDVRATFAYEIERLYGPCDVSIKKATRGM